MKKERILTSIIGLLILNSFWSISNLCAQETINKPLTKEEWQGTPFYQGSFVGLDIFGLFFCTWRSLFWSDLLYKHGKKTPFFHIIAHKDTLEFLLLLLQLNMESPIIEIHTAIVGAF